MFERFPLPLSFFLIFIWKLFLALNQGVKVTTQKRETVKERKILLSSREEAEIICTGELLAELRSLSLSEDEQVATETAIIIIRL